MQTRRVRTMILAVSAVSTVLFAGACGSGVDGAAPQVQPPAPQRSSTSEVPAAAALNVSSTAQLGNIVTDANGKTLYRFDKDTAKPSKSNCADKCLEAWPPALVEGQPTVQGVDQALVGSLKRADGTEQLTLAGWPLYTFAKDTGPGEMKGQNVQGTWFVAAPDGKKAKAAAGGQNAAATLNVVASSDLGNIVTDVNGLTLYRFDKDTAKPSKSNCAAKCLEAWPPALVTGSVRVQGVDEALVGSVKRPDGSEQLTLGGWPLYRFAQDTKAGDTKGQAVQGTWFVAAPDGKKAKTTASASGGTQGGGGAGGYGGY
ncbi:hypothetical protein [Crossiella cryophila]|uniref:Putative lipoprotein with Yx(FWY)xxD motif n=1 Tax=Crossiella cryophila TaxID=43355 RepID=A0A7W7C9X6_9PSEU|nr:hypothetical protein [Crossiella cryophila]MBB4676036.1 putative lipoprotein with Yx(FWY)xxD motif [Crossiella cryophila]